MHFDSLEFFVYLAAPCHGLTPAGIRALLKLRQTQLAARAGATGALVRVEVRNERLDLRSAGRGTPLISDFHSLICLQLIESFPARAGDLRALLAARRKSKGPLDLDELVDALWDKDGGAALDDAARKHRLSRPLLAATLWAAVKPLYEATALAYLRHLDPPLVGAQCPVCSGAPYARQVDDWLCSVCETAWPASRVCPACAGDHWHEAEGIQPQGARRLYCGGCGKAMAEYEGGDAFNDVFDLGPPVELMKQLS
ncbi:MAG: hypothetical protein IT462_10085 [Planctomycetes bacterium]|nr:hypothetical protein [Planctomycetota bacterium]